MLQLKQKRCKKVVKSLSNKKKKNKKLTRDIARDMSRIGKEYGLDFSVDLCETNLALLRMALEDAKRNRISVHLSKIFKMEFFQRESKIKWNKYKKHKYRTNPSWFATIKPLGYLAKLDEEPNFDIFADVPEEKFEYAMPKKDYYEMKKAQWERKLEDLAKSEGSEG